MEQLTCERLKENIARLKLARMNEVLDATVALAEREKMSYLSFLDRLFEEEVAAKEKRRVDMAMRLAGLPSAKTIEEYDFSFHPHLDKKTVVELFDLTFLAKHENVIFLGPPGRRENAPCHRSRPSNPSRYCSNSITVLLPATPFRM